LFVASKKRGGYTNVADLKIINPDFLVTWDIHQTSDDKEDREQQW